MTYSGLCPTSTMAISGVSAAANASRRTGSAALTSGHHDSPVSGKLEATKVRKNGGAESSLGLSRALAESGNLKSEMIGIIAVWSAKSEQRICKWWFACRLCRGYGVPSTGQFNLGEMASTDRCKDSPAETTMSPAPVDRLMSRDQRQRIQPALEPPANLNVNAQHYLS